MLGWGVLQTLARTNRAPMQTLAFLLVIASGLWLAAVAGLMALAPAYCLHLFEKMSSNLQASNWRLNAIEQGLRIFAGAALIVHAPASKLPMIFQVFGWLVVLSSIFILAIPIRWHGAYGAWWSQRLTAGVVRLLAPLPAAAGIALIYAAL